MVDTLAQNQRKNKITLADYPYERDIENRLFMASLSPTDLQVLEEILFGSIKIVIRKLAKNIGKSEAAILPILQRFEKTKLCKIEGDSITVDKEMRKYFECEMAKFDPDFKPDMEFLQSLLKKVPIHILPQWYSIPRMSNNIFESLVEKYLATPQIFQRYLLDINFPDPTPSAIAQDVFRSQDFKIPAKTLMTKYGLSREAFEAHLLHLEFSFVCCLSFEKEEEEWKEVVTPFHEWKEYLHFLRSTEVKQGIKGIKKTKPFAFIEEMVSLLEEIQKAPLSINAFPSSSEQALRILRQLKFAEVRAGKIAPLPEASEWLSLSVEDKALTLYRHPLSRSQGERTIREVEKALQRFLHSGFISFDTFIKGSAIALNDQGTVALKKVGKNWKYALPQYSEDDLRAIREVVFDFLYAAGIVALANHEDETLFSVTPFGQSLYA